MFAVRLHSKLIARHDKQATVLEEHVRRTRKISYGVIDSLTTEPGVQPYEPPPEPTAQTATAAFKVGDKVTFDDAKGKALVGIVPHQPAHRNLASHGRAQLARRLRTAGPRPRRLEKKGGGEATPTTKLRPMSSWPSS